MSPSKWVVAVAVAILSLVIVAVVALGVGATPVGRGGDASPTPRAAATDTAAPSGTAEPSDEASPVPSGDLEEAFAEIEAQVVEIRELEPPQLDPPEIIGRDELAAELEAIFEEEYTADDRRSDNITLRALGLLEPGQDYAELQLQLLGEGVLGFYDDTKRRMVVVSDSGLSAEARLTYAHEYTHALQDAAFGIGDLQDEAAEADDLSLALTALIEGDATNMMFLWAFANLTQEEMIELGEATLPDTSGIPSWMVRLIEFPYVTGFEWVQGILESGDVAAIDEAFADPPISTEQIIHFEKWRNREEPLDVAPVDVAGPLGAGWEEVESTSIGEALIRITLDYLGADSETAKAAAAGWGGDSLTVASGPDDAFALTWRLAWDSAADADEFSAAYESVADGLPFAARLLELSDTEVLVVHASSDDLLETSVEAAGG